MVKMNNEQGAPMVKQGYTWRGGLMRVVRWARLLVSNFIYTLNALLIALYLLSAWAGYIPPVYTVVPAILGLGFPLLLLLLMACTLYWLVRRRWVMLGVFAVVYLVTWSSISAYFPLNRDQEFILQEDEISLRVLSYNTCNFGWVGHSSRRPNPVLQYIRTSEPDIICLQESSLATKAEWGVTLEQMQAYLDGAYPYIHTHRAQGNGSMLILLSRYPILEEEVIPLKSRSNGAMRYRLQVGRRQVDVYNLHLESFRLIREDGEQYLDLAKQGEALKLGGALETKLGPAFQMRNVQANLIHERIKKSLEEVEVLVCGDFNDTPISYTRRKIATGLTDAYQSVGSGLGFTFTTGIFQVRIDHMFSSSALQPVKSVVDKSAVGSDHFPLLTTYVLH